MDARELRAEQEYAAHVQQLLLALIWYGALLQLYTAEITVAC